MITRSAGLVGMALLTALFIFACDQAPSSRLKGQTNTKIRFYGLVVDQDGAPLKGATIEYLVEAYPKDWTFETRGRPYDVSSVSATSGHDGTFSFEATGCHLRLQEAERTGYRHLWEQDTSDGKPSTYAYAHRLGRPLVQNGRSAPGRLCLRKGRRQGRVGPAVPRGMGLRRG